MHANQSKRLVLSAVQDLQEPASAGVIAIWLDYNYNVSLTDRACSMECLRLMRQGLLHRRDHKYQISEKGSSRLAWLRSTVQ